MCTVSHKSFHCRLNLTVFFSSFRCSLPLLATKAKEVFYFHSRASLSPSVLPPPPFPPISCPSTAATICAQLCRLLRLTAFGRFMETNHPLLWPALVAWLHTTVCPLNSFWGQTACTHFCFECLQMFNVDNVKVSDVTSVVAEFSAVAGTIYLE